MEIKGEDYSVSYDSSNETIFFKGIFRLLGNSGYADITKLLNDVAEQKPETITLGFQELKTMNSSGVKILCQFVLKVKMLKASRVVILGKRDIPWHIKTLDNLKRLMPDLILEIE